MNIVSTISPEEYYSVLSSVLTPKGFERTEVYIDQFEGQVVDYFFNEERMTCIVSIEDVQILSFLRGRFGERLLKRTKGSVAELRVYVADLVDNSN